MFIVFTWLLLGFYLICTWFLLGFSRFWDVQHPKKNIHKKVPRRGGPTSKNWYGANTIGTFVVDIVVLTKQDSDNYCSSPSGPPSTVNNEGTLTEAGFKHLLLIPIGATMHCKCSEGTLTEAGF